MSGNNQVKHFMVKNPVCAQLWQSLSLIRETMLANQFTYLPVFVKEGGKSWQLVSDFKLAQYLRSGNPSSTEKNRLARRLEEAAHGSGALELLLAGTVTENDSIEVALSRSEGRPVVVSTGESEFSEHLWGSLLPLTCYKAYDRDCLGPSALGYFAGHADAPRGRPPCSH